MAHTEWPHAGDVVGWKKRPNVTKFCLGSLVHSRDTHVQWDASRRMMSSDFDRPINGPPDEKKTKSPSFLPTPNSSAPPSIQRTFALHAKDPEQEEGQARRCLHQAHR